MRNLKNCCLLILIYVSTIVHAFQSGDFIQTARKAQFHQQRTNWHDLLGHHCPRFGQDKLVSVPLQKPILPLSELDEYKLQLSFDGDRHVTPWLKVIGKNTPTVPVVEVELRRSGEELLGVVAKVIPAPLQYQHSNQALVDEFRNASHWPKHLMVHYRWKTENDVDLDRGLFVLFAAGVMATVLLIFSAVQGAGPKLALFLQEVSEGDVSGNGAGPSSGGAGPGAGAGPSTSAAYTAAWKGGAKAE